LCRPITVSTASTTEIVGAEATVIAADARRPARLAGFEAIGSPPTIRPARILGIDLRETM
jgi:hypothetical protein